MEDFRKNLCWSSGSGVWGCRASVLKVRKKGVVDNCVKTGVVVKHERGQARLPVSGSLRQKVARSLVMLGLEMLWAGVVAIWMPWVCSWVVNL